MANRGSRLGGRPRSGGRAPPRAAVTRLEAHARRRARHDCVLDCSRAAADLGWRGSADVRDAVRRTIEFEIARSRPAS